MVLIQFRRGTASEWTSQNTVLSAGELGFETNTGRFKIGDGEAAWNSLGYLGAEYGEVDVINNVTAGTATAGKALVADSNLNINLGEGSLTASSVTIGENLTITGNLTVNGTTTTVNSTTLTVDDKNIELGSVENPSDAGADGGGITLKGTSDKTFNWVDATDAWTSSEHMNLVTGKEYYINGVSVLNATGLGSGVISSSLTSVGTISVGTWEGTDVGVAHGGTGASTASDARDNLGLTIGTNVQAYDATLAALAGVSTSADQLIYATGSDTFSTTTLTSFGRSLVDDVDADAARTTLGLVIGTNVQAYDATLAALAGVSTSADQLIYATGSDTFSTTSLTSFGRSLVDDASASDARDTLGLTIGTNVQAYDATLAALAGVSTSADQLIYATGSDTFSTTTLTSFGRSLVDDVDADAARTTLGLVIGTNVQAYDAELAALAGLTSTADALPYFTGNGTASTTTLTSFGRSLVDDASASDARDTLGLTIGTNVQAYDATLAALAGVSTSADQLIYATGSDTFSVTTLTSFGRSLIDDNNAAEARTTLELGALAVLNSIDGGSP
jgi:hypothetical protein